MKPFRRQRDGLLHAVFSREEADVVVALAVESAAIAENAGAESPDPSHRFDPAFRRLLPDAYPDDPAASAEFRRFTAGGLAERKADNARLVVESLAGVREGRRNGQVDVSLDEAGASAWLRAITDVRLVLAARLGIVQDGDEGVVDDDEAAFRRAVYDWLAYVQETLVMALSRR